MGRVTVEPASGPIGTVFVLVAQNLKEGDAVAFEIIFPGEGKAYPSLALLVPRASSTTVVTRPTTTSRTPST